MKRWQAIAETNRSERVHFSDDYCADVWSRDNRSVGVVFFNNQLTPFGVVILSHEEHKTSVESYGNLPWGLIWMLSSKLGEEA